MTILSKLYQYDPAFTRLLEEIQGGKSKAYLHGFLSESTGPFLSSLAEIRKSPVFVVCDSQKRARDLAEELGLLLGDRAVFYPQEPSRFFLGASEDSPLSRQRIQVMDRLSRGDQLVVTTTLAALKRPITPPRSFQAASLDIHLGGSYDLEDLLLRLHRMGYVRTTTVEYPGDFALRGGILDLFPPSLQQAVRLEFFDIELDSLRFFDIQSQRSTESVQAFRLSPAKSLQMEEEDLEEAGEGLRKDLASFLRKTKDKTIQERAEGKFAHLLDDLEDQAGLAEDLLAPYLSQEAKAFLFDYLPDGALVFYEDYDRIWEEEKKREEAEAAHLTSLFEQGEILSQMLKPPSAEAIFSGLACYTELNLLSILKTARHFHPDLLLQIKSLEMDSYKDRWEDLVRDLRRRQGHKYRTVVFAGSALPGLAERMQESNLSFRVVKKEEEVPDIPEGSLLLTDQDLARGFSYPDSQLALISRREIVGAPRKKKKAYKKRKKSDLFNYQDLEVGDFVVHEIYGVGRYLGTETLELGEVTKDFIKIAYQGTDVLYVAMDEMDLVSKYIGSGGPKPKLSSLGGAEWKRSKERAKKALEAIAEDLLELYAKRSKIKGHAYPPDTPWQKDFEDAFAYEDTPSQIRATQEIKEDMETDRPMDRLLCGDVGYGKTEVALRAAFKAILDGKQVAFLAPTTILVQQHYQTMMERFRNFPARIEFLSRFKSADQQKAVIAGLKTGEVDMVVGTHRLLSKDIHFKDLGLLVVDEEQRFGVKDKEKMKEMKESVDVLTLSATPIPRTLQFSLTGIRDMSLLEEPPEDRYPTVSYVMEMDPFVIQEAIEKELDRGGQVYVVHNRVHDIHAVYTWLKDLVPEAEILVGHGQMTPRQLEGVMENFVAGRGDILLSTSIIETGMDIPNANTLIVLHADRMGLAQLYQLKGRIGRSERQSYAYFTYERSKVLSENSEKRLKAIRDFTEFGSGYKIAMRDLELRGAGNLLGESQSGHIASIGYELYVRMLEEAVNEAKGAEKKEEREEVKVDLSLSAYIPDSYIPQSSDKLSMYRQIASIASGEDFDRMVEELIDRYGDPPRSVVNLMRIVQIKRLAGSLGFHQIKESQESIDLIYQPFERFSIEELKEISNHYRAKMSFDFRNTPTMKLSRKGDKLKNILNLLHLIASQIKQGRKEDEE